MSFITSGVAVFSSTLPTPVTGFIASNPTQTTVDLVWNRSPVATLYSIETSPPSGTMTTTDTFITFMELTPGTEYKFLITPSNANGNGSWTESNPISTISPAPDAVTGFVASNPQDYSIDLAWNPSPTATLYYLVSSPPMTNFNTSDTFFTFTGLDPATEYTFTITPSNAYGDGPPTTSDPISTLLPLPYNGNDITPSNPTATSFDLSWDPSDYAASYDLYELYFSLGPISVTGTTYTWAGLTPDTYYSFYLIPVNATGSGVQSTPTDAKQTLIRTNLTYTGTIETLELRPGNYRFQMAGGSGPVRPPTVGGGHSSSEYILDYTVTSPITIQYAIGQASPGDVGGGGGTYMYDLTNSQWLFVAGGAGTYPAGWISDPGDGSGGAAGDGGGSGAGVISNGSDSMVSAGSGGLTFGNGGTGGAAGTFGDGPQPGGFGGGGGGTVVYDPNLQIFYGEYAYYPGGGGGYTGGTTTTFYIPGDYAYWDSAPGLSYMISGATIWSQNYDIGGAPVTNGYININPS